MINVDYHNPVIRVAHIENIIVHTTLMCSWVLLRKNGNGAPNESTLMYQMNHNYKHDGIHYLRSP